MASEVPLEQLHVKSRVCYERVSMSRAQGTSLLTASHSLPLDPTLPGPPQSSLHVFFCAMQISERRSVLSELAGTVQHWMGVP